LLKNNLCFFVIKKQTNKQAVQVRKKI